MSSSRAPPPFHVCQGHKTRGPPPVVQTTLHCWFRLAVRGLNPWFLQRVDGKPTPVHHLQTTKQNNGDLNQPLVLAEGRWENHLQTTKQNNGDLNQPLVLAEGRWENQNFNTKLVLAEVRWEKHPVSPDCQRPQTTNGRKIPYFQ